MILKKILAVRLIVRFLGFLVLTTPAGFAQTSVIKKNGDNVTISWDYANASQTGFRLKSNTIGDGAAFTDTGRTVGATAREIVFPANFPSGVDKLYFRIAAFNAVTETSQASPTILVRRGIGPPGNVRAK